jgi:DNA-binding MarR family transcriptional regulator
MNDLLALLWMVNASGQRTTTEIAVGLDVTESEAVRVLTQAQSDGWVAEEIDESARLPDSQRRFWYVTVSGLAEMQRLEEETGRRR